ncbi:MAG: hypothetical protein NVSMB59_23090 [Vulcanimicrobiaceae bacterium]
MPLYEFRCAACGPFDVRCSIGALEGAACPQCAVPATRVFTSPLLDRMALPLRHALNREERSAHVPDVVRRPVCGGGH